MQEKKSFLSYTIPCITYNEVCGCNYSHIRGIILTIKDSD
jgi:hypothetical protein